MNEKLKNCVRTHLIWLVLLAVIILNIALAATSPLLAWRNPTYIVAGFSGVVALTLVLVQPILIAGLLPWMTRKVARHMHRVVGIALMILVVIHVVGLWITSPPDVVDALLFLSATPFSAWSVIAMWAVFAAGFVAMMRSKLKLRPLSWRRIHTALTIIVVIGSVVHAMQIEGTMEPASKAVLCAVAVIAMLKTLIDLKVWKLA